MLNISHLFKYTFKKKKNPTHAKKVGHTSEFMFGIYWWTLKNPKIQNFEKWKHLLEISSFYTCVPKTTTETEFFVILGDFLPFYHPLPLTTQKIKILKNEKNILKCHHFKHFKLLQQKIWSYDTECERQIFLSF